MDGRLAMSSILTERPIDRVLARLESANKRGADQYDARCPGHEDRNASLSVTIGDDGRVLLKCHAGCETSHVVETMGLKLSDLFPPKDEAPRNGHAKRNAPKQKRAHPSKQAAVDALLWSVRKQLKEKGNNVEPVEVPECEEHYVWPGDTAGEAWVIRFRVGDDKTYRAVHRVGENFYCGDPAGKFPPLRLSEIADEPVVILCEGGKAALAGARIKLPTTASAHGAKSAKKTDWSCFRGKTVIILADADTPGMKYANDVAAILTKLGCTVKVLQLESPSGDTFAGYDLYDFIQEHDSKEDAALRALIQSLIDAAPVWTPPTAEEAEPATDAALGEVAPDGSGRILLSRSITPPSAMAFRRDHFTTNDTPTLYTYRGDIFAYNNALNRYEVLDANAVRSQLQHYLLNAVELTPKYEVTPFSVNARAVSDVVDALRNVSYLNSSLNPPFRGMEEFPSLIMGRTRNHDIRTGKSTQPDPSIFNTTSLDFDVDPNAPPPVRFLQFLFDLWGDDQKSIGALQEYIAYCLVRDARFQKMLLIIGPRRSGKGTLGRILSRLVGESAVVGPTVSGLAGPFGLQCLLHKRVAIIGDARFSGPDAAIFVERALTISGGDVVTVDLKHRDPVTQRLDIKFVCFTNEAPKFNDASAALVSRFLVLRLTKSHYGAEDHQLFEKLAEEMPGIFNWALEGLRRLYARGHFIQPDAGHELIASMEEMSSPVSVFVRDHCVLGSEERAVCDALYQRFRRWCETEGHTISSKPVFSRNLRAAFPRIETKQYTDGSRFYAGIGLKEEGTYVP